MRAFPKAKYKRNAKDPVAAIMALAMMLDYIGESEASVHVESVVNRLICEGDIQSLSAGVQGTSEIGDLVASAVAAGE